MSGKYKWIYNLINKHDLTPDDIKKLKEFPDIDRVSAWNKAVTASLKPKDPTVDIKKAKRVTKKYRDRLKIKKKE